MKQEEYFGTGSIEKLSDILNGLVAKKIFLVTGKDSFITSGAKEISDRLLSGFTVNQFNDFSGNPSLEEIERGIRKYKDFNGDVIIAIGGGSVIDTAKAINILSAHEENAKLITEGKAKINRKGKKLIAIPTTSGAGSEATHFAVIYIDKNKYSLADEFILPDVVITDPQFTFELNPKITATSGIDALCQAVESYWCVNSTEESKKYSAEAITLIIENLNEAVNNSTKENRIKMSRAASLAGKAINITKTTAPHAVSYSMTSYFGIPHGQAVSITLGEFLVYNYSVTEKDLCGTKSAAEIKSSIDDLVKLFDCRNVNDADLKIKNLMRDIGLKTRLSELGIKTKDDLEVIINNVNTERLQNNPRAVTKESLYVILNAIL